MRTNCTRVLTAFVAAIVLITAACAESTTSDGSGADPDTSSTTADDAGASAGAGSGEVSDTVQWAVDYTGGTAGTASGEPFTIGFVNQEALFPEATTGAQAAADFVNTELGGIAGRPLEITTCEISTDEDGTRCGTQMLNDAAVDVVVTGSMTVGNQQLYDVLKDQKPVVISNALTNADFLTTAGVSYTTGAVGVIPGLGEFAAKRLDPPAESVAVVYADSDGGRAAYQGLLEPLLEEYGVEVNGVPVAEAGATASDVQAAMIAAGADKADVFIPLVAESGCIATYDAIQQMGIDPTVVTTALCFGKSMREHLDEVGDGGDIPEGWYTGGYGYAFFKPDLESGMTTYLEKIKEYGGDDIEYAGFSGPSFFNVLTVAKFANQLDGDTDPTSMKEKVFGFTGPMMGQAGDLTCGTTTVLGITFPAVCGHVMGVQQLVDGEWRSAGDALDGNPIDVTTIGN